MTTPQLSALEWAVKVLPRTEPSHLATLIAMLNNAKTARNNNAMPAAESDVKNTKTISAALIYFFNHNNIVIPQREMSNWRMLPREDRRIGHINALPESRGRIVCTDGILCYIDRGFGVAPYLGHFSWFKADEDIAYYGPHTPKNKGGRKPGPAKEKKPSKRDREAAIMEELIA